ncbi:MAG: serine hydrolase domain-containing protein [Gammaproteobacteria bacterium]
MSRRKLLLLVLLAGFAWFNVLYWQDTAFWRRWWDTVTHLEPDRLNLSPTEVIGPGAVRQLPVASGDSRTIDPAALQASVEYARRFDSFSLIVIHKGIVQLDWYNEGWNDQRLTQSQSMHKTVAAILIGIAIEEGLIASVDDPVGDYLSEWQGDARGAITLRNLMNMSSGLALPRFTLNPFATDTSFRFLFSQDRENIVLNTELAWQPGDHFEYNDINAQIIGMVVERATGRRYADYLGDKLWRPMGGAHAEVWLDREQGLAMSACCLLAPAMEWARLGVLLEAGGRRDGDQIIPAQWLAEMLTPSAGNAGYGLFTWLGAGMLEGQKEDVPDYGQSEPYLSDDTYLLLGYGGQRVFIAPALDIVIVRLGPFSGMQPLKDGWDNAWLMNTIIRGIK